MSTIAPVYVEFRCNRCWNSNCAQSEAVGTEVPCRNCGQELTVPEATPDRIARALALLEELPELNTQRSVTKTNATPLDHQFSDQELIEIARRESFVPLHQMNFRGYPTASLIARLVANVLDGVFLVGSMILGFVLVHWMAKLGIVESPFSKHRPVEEIRLASFLVMGILPILFVVSQWILLATSGQTIGKKLLMIRIVTESGTLPGFLQAVVLRNWLRYALSFIPFFSLIDALFIFSDSRRCLHDYLAGTKVVSLV